MSGRHQHRHPPAARTKVALRRGEILSGGFAQPFDGLVEILFNAFAGEVHQREVALGVGVSLRSGFLEPIRRLGGVRSHTLSIFASQAHCVLRIGVTGIGFGLDAVNGCVLSERQEKTGASNSARQNGFAAYFMA